MNKNRLQKIENKHVNKKEKKEWTQEDTQESIKYVCLYLIFITLALWITFLSVMVLNEFYQINSTLT